MSQPYRDPGEVMFNVMVASVLIFGLFMVFVINSSQPQPMSECIAEKAAQHEVDGATAREICEAWR